MARLPNIGGDGSNWGTVLNSFLAIAHETDGSLKAAAIEAFFDSLDGVEGQVLGIDDGVLAYIDPPSGGTPLNVDEVAYGDPTDTTVAIPAPFFDVIARGADLTGSANSRDAFQSALDAAVAAGSGTIRPPRGIYKIQIAQTGAGVYGLSVEGDNITLDLTDGAVLDFYPYGGDPDTNWQNVGGVVYRGHCIFVSGGATYADRRKGFRLQGGEINGNYTATGNHAEADVSTGDGWDVSHHAVHFENDTYQTDHLIQGSHLHNFAGELVYSGGADTGDEPVNGTYTIDRCPVHDTNGAGLSIAGRKVTITDNTIHDTAGSGIENATQDGVHELAFNRIYATGLDAISNVGYGEGVGGFETHHNTIRDSAQYGIGLFSTWFTNVYENRIIDCVDGGVREELGTGYPNDTMRNTHVSRNTFLADTIDMPVGVNIGLGAGEAEGINRVDHNSMQQTPYAVTNGYIVSAPIATFSDTEMRYFDIRDNDYIGEFSATTKPVGQHVVAPNGSQVNVAEITPVIDTLMSVQVHLEVLTGTPQVWLTIVYVDFGGSVRTITLENFTNPAAGKYYYPAYLVEVGKRSIVKVTLQSNATNAVYASATIREA